MWDRIKSLVGARSESRPLFSILHPSARPEQWRKIYDAWMKACVNPQDVEYVLCVDERWGFGPLVPEESPAVNAPAFGCAGLSQGRGAIDKCVWNEGRRCYVDAVNTAAKAATGRILIVIADDQWPCEQWDEELVKAMFVREGQSFGPDVLPDGEFVVSVSTGTPQEHERGIMVMPILSRARYERLGYVFYPEYESMYADNDFCEHAKHDGVVINAKHLVFPHEHNLWCPEVPWDDAYQAQNSGAAYVLGKGLLDRRRAVNFDGIAPIEKSGPPLIAVCLPGENFSSHVMAAWTELYTHLLRRGFSVAPCFDHYSNVYFTRQAMSEAALLVNPDFILWIDDDQILTPANFDLLFDRLKSLPDADVVAGWTWIPGDKERLPQVSAGKHVGNAVTFVPLAEIARCQLLGAAFEVEWTGFPAVLMKGSAMVRANAEAATLKMSSAFMPIFTPQSRFSVSGEDIAFCVHAKKAGCKIYVDARVKLPHLKLQAVPDPTPVETIHAVKCEDQGMYAVCAARESLGVYRRVSQV